MAVRRPDRRALNLSFDGARYLEMGRGVACPRPFALRWWLPWMNRDRIWAWRLMQYWGLACCCVLAVGYTHAWAAAFVPLGLAGVSTFNLKFPVLVDLPAMALALASACAAQRGWWIVAVAFALVAGAMKETAPVFAALWAWSPILLLGLVAPALAYVFAPHGPDPIDPAHRAGAALRNPLATSWAAHREMLTTAPEVLLMPWGALLVGLGFADWRALIVVAVAYGQILVATDTVRLYQWAWPTLAALTFAHVPRAWWPVLVVLHLANPVKTGGL